MNQNQNVKSDITRTVANVEPVGVVFNLTSKVIEDFIGDYLVNVKGIDGVEAVRVFAKGDFKGPKVTVAVFISRKSADVTNNKFQVNSIIADNMDQGTFYTSNKLQSALSKIANSTKLNSTGKKNEPLFIRLNPAKVLGLMLAADPHRHEIGILETKAIKNQACVMSVIKKEKFVAGEAKTDDRYTKILMRN